MANVIATDYHRRPIVNTSALPSGVIVADDDPVILSVLKTRLEALGQPVMLANNGLEAIDIATRVQASLVLLDIDMPEADGVSACAQIRSLPGYCITPIVMLTGYDNEQAQIASSHAGATMFLTKPFSTASLMLTLSRFLPISDAALQNIHDNAVRASGGKIFNTIRARVAG
jgi:CheY-like chemotaxis protein